MFFHNKPYLWVRISIAGVMAMIMVMSPFFNAWEAQAAIPQTINYQSRLLTPGGLPVTSTTAIQLSFYLHPTNGTSGDAPAQAGPLVWKEVYDQGSGACSMITPDSKGYFFLKLGSCSPFPAYLDFSEIMYVGVKIGADAEALPRVQLSSHPYALNSYRLNGFEATSTATANQLLALDSNLNFNIATGTFTGAGLFINGTSTLQQVSFTVATGTSLNLTQYLAIGAIRLDSIGSNNQTSGAYLVGIFDEFTNSNATTVQAALFDLDTAITTVSSTLYAMDLQLVTDNGNITTNWIEFAGATSVGDIIPGTHDNFTLGNSDLRWADVWSGVIHIGTSTWDLAQADNGAFTVGQNGGMPALVIATSGNVGIGTENPAETLDVVGQKSAFSRYTNDNLGFNYIVQKARGTLAAPLATMPGDILGQYTFKAYDGTDYQNMARLFSKRSSGTLPGEYAGEMQIQVKDVLDVNPVAKFYFKAGGKLGIGASTPAYSLDVVGDARLSAQLMLGRYAVLPVSGNQSGAVVYNTPSSTIHYWDGMQWRTVATAEDIRSSLWDADNDTGIQVEESADEDYIRFDTAGVERMFIQNNGRVGINTVGPLNAGLQIGHGGHMNAALSINGNPGDVGIMAVRDEDGEDIFTAMGSLANNDFVFMMGDTGNAYGNSYGGTTGITINQAQEAYIFGRAPIRLNDNGGGEYVGFMAPASVKTSTIWTLPTQDGVNNQVLITNGAGTLGWATSSDLVYNIYNSNGLIPENRNVTIADGNELRFVDQNNPANFLYFQPDYNTNGNLRIGAVNNDEGNANSYLEFMDNFKMVSEHGIEIDAGTNQADILGNTGILTIGGPSQFNDLRAVGSRNGLRYAGDYSADFVDRSLVDKEYVDNAITSSTVTASNGLSIDSGVVKLGGDLSEMTYINHYGYDLIVREFAGEPETLFSGDNFKIIDTTRNRRVQFGISGEDTSGIEWRGDAKHDIYYRNNALYIDSNTSTFRGMQYALDYSGNYTNRSLVDKEYVDNANHWQKNTNVLSPSDSAVYQIAVTNNNASTLTGYKAVNTNDVSNYAGAVIEMKGSGADFTNNLYFGKYGAGFWIPSWAGNGVLATDKNLILGTLGAATLIRFQVGGGYSAPASKMTLDADSLDLLAGVSLNVGGNTVLGDATSDTVTLTARVNSHVLPSVNNNFDLGSPSLSWRNIYASGTIYGNVVGYINPGYTEGSVIFQGTSSLQQDNTNFYWDDTVNRLLLGSNASSTATGRKLEVNSAVSAGQSLVYLRNGNGGGGGRVLHVKTKAGNSNEAVLIDNDGTGPGLSILNGGAGNVYGLLVDSGRVGFGTTTPAFNLDLVGDARLSAQLMLGQYALNPASGLQAGAMIYNTASSTPFFWDGTEWVALLGEGDYTNALWDTDHDTGIQVEESADEDIIRFDTMGTEYFTMQGPRLSVLNSGNSVFLGQDAGRVDDLTDNRNVFIGRSAGYSNTTGISNVYIGYQAGYTATNQESTVAIGREAGRNNTGFYGNTLLGYCAGANNTGNDNVMVGYESGVGNTGGDNFFMGRGTGWNNTGNQNIMMGYFAGYDNKGSNTIMFGNNTGSGNKGNNGIFMGNGAGFNNIGNDNIFLGYETGLKNATGTRNLFLGRQAGYGNILGNGNIFLGYQAGYSETNSDRLYIDNSNTATPLVYGQFDTNILRINGALQINNPSSTGYVLPMADGDAGQFLTTNGAGNVVWASSSALGADTLQDVTDRGATTTNWIQFAGATSVGDIIPGLHDTYSLGNTDYRWADVWGSNVHIGTSTWDLAQATNGALTVTRAGGSEAMRILTNGNVGIGTDLPGGYRLNVAGNAYFSVGEDTSVFTVYNSPKDNNHLRVDGDSDYVVLQENSGNVGIGESAPAYKLHINGGIANGDNLFRAEAGLNGGYINMYVSSTDDRNSVIGFQRNLEFFSQNQMVMTMTNSQRVGVGVTNPVYRLDVLGDARLSAQFMLGQYALNPASGLQAGAMIYNTASSTPFFWNGATWKAVASQDSITLDKAYDAGGLVPGGGRHISVDTGPVSLTDAGNGTSLTIENTGLGQGISMYQSGAGQAVYIRQVGGTGLLLENNTANNGLEIFTADSGTGVQISNQGSSSNGMRIDNDTDGAGIYIDDTLGSASINISKPSGLGDLFRLSNSGTGDVFDINNTSSGTVFKLANTGTGNSLIITDEALDTTPFVLNSSGSLGIGTATPNSKLQISEDNSSADASLLRFQASNNSDIQSEIYFSMGGNATYWDINSSGSGGALIMMNESTELAKFTNNGVIINDASANNVDFRVESDTETHALFVDATNGNVGFEQSTPLAKLHVGNTSAGSLADYNYLRMQGTGDVDHRVYSPSGSNLMIWDYNATGNGGAIEFRNYTTRVGLFTNSGLVINDGGVTGVGLRVEGDTNANLLYTDAANDRVGIGTNSPLVRLHVTQSGNIVAAFDRTTSDGTIISLRQNNTEEGTISVSGTTVSYNAFTGSHYAWTDEQIERGMLVSLTGDNRNLRDNPQSEIIYGVAKTAVANDSKVMGAYLALQESNKAYDESNPHLIMAVGNGEMWVADKGENINIGDYLISSDVAGHAQKDTGEFIVSHIIAKSAESIDWANVTNEIDGVKQAKISVFFESFDKSNMQASVAGTSLQGGDANLDVVDLAVGNAVFEGSITVMEHVVLSRDTVGQAMILTGENKVSVTFEMPYDQLPIVTVTPYGAKRMDYGVENVSLTGFEIVIDPIQYKDTIFNWQAFGNREAKVFVSNGTTLDIEMTDMGTSKLETQINANGQSVVPAPVEEVVEPSTPPEEVVVEELPAEEEVDQTPPASEPEIIEEAVIEEEAPVSEIGI